MNYRTSILGRRTLRAYAAAFVSYLMLVGQVAPLALGAAPKRLPAATAATAPARAAAAPAAPLPFAAPNIVATKSDAYPSHPSGKAEPGDTVTYTVTITNTGDADATGVVFTDNVSGDTTLVSGSTVVAASDSYHTIGNVRINVPAAEGLLANDSDPDATTLTATAATVSSAQCPGCNNVTISADGSFTYDPPTNFNGTDTFAYTTNDAGSHAAATTARVAVSGKIWFVNTNAGACTSNCDGRLSHPFTSLAAFQAVNDGGAGHPAAGDFIFLFESPNDYVGPVTLLNNQKLFGQDGTASLISLTGYTQPSGTDPLPAMDSANATITNITTTAPATNAVTIGAGNSNLLRGFTVGNTTGSKITSSPAPPSSNFGTLTVNEVALAGTGQALNLDNGTLAATFTSIASTTSGAQGISLEQIAGSLTVTGGTSVTNPVTQCILVTASTADMNFGNTTCSDATDGISLQNNSAGTRTFGSLSVTNGSAVAFLHANAGGTTNVTGATTITNPGTNGISVQNSTTAVTFANASVAQSDATGVVYTGSSGNLGFAKLDISPDPADQALNANNNTGTLSSTSGTVTTTNANAITSVSTALNLVFDSVSAGIPAATAASGVLLTSSTGTVTINGGTISGGGAAAFAVTGGSVSATYKGGLSQANAQPLFIASGGHTGTVTFDTGTLSATGGNGLQFDNADGTYNFNGTTTLGGGDAGVDIFNTSDGSFNFSSGVSVTNPTGTAFSVSGGTPTVSYAGTVTQNNGARVVDIQGTTADTVSFSGTVTGGASSQGVHIGDTTAVNGNVSFSTLNLGTSGARMTSQAVTISGGPSTATYSLGAVSIFTNGGTATGISAANFDGTLNISSGTVDATSGMAINVNGPAGFTVLGINLGTVNSTGGTNNVALTNTDGTFSVTGGALSGASGSAFLVSGGSPSATFGGTVTQNNAARVVDIQGTTADTVTFNGTVAAGGTSTGVLINNANGGNVTFTTLNLGSDPGAGGARLPNQAVTILKGTGSGNGTFNLGAVTVWTNNVSGIVATDIDGTVSNSSGRVNSGSGSAVNIDGPAGLTTLGLTFTRLDSSGGTATGLILQDTNGAFNVLGDGSNAAEGGNGTGGTIANKDDGGTDNSGTVGTGVFLNNATGVTLRRMQLNDLKNFGIRGQSVGDFTFQYSTINGLNGDTILNSEGAIGFGTSNPSGVNGLADGAPADKTIVLFDNLKVSGAIEHNVEFYNQAGDNIEVTFSNSDVTDNTPAAGGDGIQIEMQGTASAKFTINAVLFDDNKSQAVQATSADSSFVDVTINGCTLTRSTQGNEGWIVSNGGNSDMVAHITNNNSTGINGVVIFAGQAPGNATASSSMAAVITGNTITHGTGALNHAIFVAPSSTVGQVAPSNYLVQGNTITENSTSGIARPLEINTPDANTSPSFTASVISNNFSVGDNVAGLSAQVAARHNSTACFDIRSNTTAFPNGVPGGGTVRGLRAREDSTNTVQLEQGSSAGSAATVLAANNPGATTEVIGTIAVVSNSTCQAPPTGPVSFESVTEVPGASAPVATAPSRVVKRRPVALPLNTTVTPAAPKAAAPVSAAPKAPAPKASAPKVVAPQVVAPKASASAVAAPRAVKTEAKRSAGTVFRHTAEDSSAPLLAPEPAAAQRRKVSAPVLTSGPVAPHAAGTGGTVSINIGTLHPQDSVTITFQVVIEDPYTGGANISNQGTVSSSTASFANVVTDDPDTVATPNDATLTPVDSLSISVNDAKVAEPVSPNTVDMTFTVALSQPSSGGGVNVTFTTADNTATAGTCGDPGADYVATSGTLIFGAGEQIKTINVPICPDGVADDGETFFVNLTGSVGGTIIRNQAVGTITANTPGVIQISELRTSGPSGPNDDFIELYNNSDTPHTVDSADNTGYGIFQMGANCDAAPVLIATVPEGTVIPARGHYLKVGTAYSLANYGGAGAAAGDGPAFTSDLGNDNNVGVFSTADVLAVSSANRLDAVGFTPKVGGVCNLLREGDGLAQQGASVKEYTYFRKQCDFVGGTGCTAGGNPKDSNANSADFQYADTAPDMSGTQKLGAPGPENMESPLRRDNAGIGTALLDGNVATSAHPNRERKLSPGLGSLVIRRRVFNNTGSSVKRLRFRIVEMTTFPSPPGSAELRATTSTGDESVSPVHDTTTCGAAPTPCTVLVKPTTLETPPAQASGGGLNSTLSAGTITTATPLANGESINLRFVLNIHQTGTFRFYIIIEALPL